MKEILDYDPVTGVFTYKIQRTSRKQAGEVAGFVSKRSRDNGGGYRIVCIRDDGKKQEYAAHRLAYFWMTGEWPEHQVDHRNRVRDDNRWDNLRKATRVQNLGNRDKYANNTSGLKGVSWHKAGNKWRSDIQVDNESLFLGLHRTQYGAATAYALAAYLYHGEFSNFDDLDTSKESSEVDSLLQQDQHRYAAKCPSTGTHFATDSATLN